MCVETTLQRHASTDAFYCPCLCRRRLVFYIHSFRRYDGTKEREQWYSFVVKAGFWEEGQKDADKIGPSSQGPRGKRPPQPGKKCANIIALMPSSRLAAVGILAMARRSTAFEFKSAQNKEAYALRRKSSARTRSRTITRSQTREARMGKAPRSKKR